MRKACVKLSNPQARLFKNALSVEETRVERRHAIASIRFGKIMLALHEQTRIIDAMPEEEGRQARLKQDTARLWGIYTRASKTVEILKSSIDAIRALRYARRSRMYR